MVGVEHNLKSTFGDSGCQKLVGDLTVCIKVSHLILHKSAVYFSFARKMASVKGGAR